MEFKFKHPNSGEVKTLTLSEVQMAEMIEIDDLLGKMVSNECNCEPTGETNVVECGCDEYLCDFELQG